MKISAITSASPNCTRVGRISDTVKQVRNDAPKPQDVSFKGKGLAVLGGAVGAFLGAVLLGPLGALAGAALGGGAGAVQDDNGELDDYTREKVSHYD